MLKCARALFRPLWCNKSSVCLRPLYGLLRSQRGVDVSVRGCGNKGGSWCMVLLQFFGGRCRLTAGRAGSAPKSL